MSLFSFGERKREANDEDRLARPEFGGFMLPTPNLRHRNIPDVIPNNPQKNHAVEPEATKPTTKEVSISPQKELPKEPGQKNRKKENPKNLKTIKTVSGNYILSKDWENSNMSVFRSKKRK